jgi:hypothetical protein
MHALPGAQRREKRSGIPQAGNISEGRRELTDYSVRLGEAKQRLLIV